MRRRRWHLHRSAEPRRGWSVAFLLVGVFSALALLTRLVCLDSEGNTSFWPANAALVAAILLLPARKSAAVIALCVVVNLSLNGLTFYKPAESIVFSALNVGVSYLAAFLTRSLCGAAIDLSRFRRLSTFGAIAFASAGCEAALGEVLLRGTRLDANAASDWLQWTLCDGFGLLLATPAILAAIRRPRVEDPCDAKPLERWLLMVGNLALSGVGFSQSQSPLFLAIYPMLILIAFRAGPPWVLASVLMTALVASGMTAHGLGPLTALSTRGALLTANMVQPYLISLFLAAVPANNALGERSRDMRRLRLMKAALEYSATHDGLTTLINRDLFQRRLKAFLLAGKPCAVFLIDLDRFKEVNDTLGHQAGDELLRAFSKRVMRVVAGDVSVARFGGDEFALLMACGRSTLAPYDVGKTIAEVARQPFELSCGPASVSASVGVALSVGSRVAGDELLRQADVALYAVKAHGRNDCRLYTQDLERAATHRAGLQTSQAISGDRIGALTG